MSERVWHKGPPPHVGWWQASYAKDGDTWRWWDGKCWSEPAWESMSSGTVGHQANRTSYKTHHLWTDYWPENARVPRLDPTGGHWTFNVDGRVPETGENIEVAYRGGLVIKRKSFDLMGADWRLDGGGCDILAWRPAA